MKIQQYGHGELNFWQVMGPNFASAKVQRDLGVPMTSDEATTWFVAMDGETVAGFAAVRLTKSGVAELKHAYVFEPYRQQGVYAQLLDARLRFARQVGATSCRATVAPAIQQHYADAGFTETRRQGRYVHFEMRLGA